MLDLEERKEGKKKERKKGRKKRKEKTKQLKQDNVFTIKMFRNNKRFHFSSQNNKTSSNEEDTTKANPQYGNVEVLSNSLLLQ